MTRIARIIVKFRVLILLLSLGVTGICLPGLFQLNITVDIQDYFLENDPVLAGQKAFDRLFSSQDFIGILVESEDAFSPESLELIKKLGQIIEKSVPGAGTVQSITELTGVLTGGKKIMFDGSQLLSDEFEIEELRNGASASPLLNGLYFSSDYKDAWVILPLEEDTDYDIFEIGRLAWEAIEEIDTGDLNITAAGVPIFAYRKQVELMQDLMRVLLFGALAAVLLSAGILRSLQGVLGTLAVFIFSVITVLGVQGWIGVKVDSAFMAVPILLTIGISIGYSVHVHRFFHLGFTSSGKRRQSVEKALVKTIRPIFFTAVTTIAALLSFLFVNVRPIHWVGLTSSFCILAAFLMTVLVFPSVISIGRDSEPKISANRKEKMAPVFIQVGHILKHHNKAILFIFVAVTVSAVIGLFRLTVDFDAVKMMGTKLPHMQDQIHIGESEIAVGEYMNIVVRMPDGSYSSAQHIYQIQDLENRLLRIDGIQRVRSITDVLREVNSLLHRRSEDFSGLPENPVSLEALLRLVDGLLPGERLNWLAEDYGDARIFIEISDFSSRKIEGIIHEIEALVPEIFPDGHSLMFSGSTYQVARMNQYITRGLVQSIAVALLTISLIMILVFRSFRWGLIAMIPNVFPVIIAGGILGFAGIPLEFVTMTVAPIILGLAVDDTIHFISFLKEDMADTGIFEVSLVRAFNSVGTAITETTLILCATFLVFLISRINSIMYMGIIAASGMVAAYLADILVTPILVRQLAESKQRKSNRNKITR